MIPLGCRTCDCWWSSKYLLTRQPPFLIILADNLSITFSRHFRKQWLAWSKSAPDLSWGWEQADSSATNLSSFKHLGKLEINHVQTRPVSQARFHVLWEAGEVRVLGSAVTNFSRLKWYSILLCCFSWRGKCIGNYHRKPRRGKHNRECRTGLYCGTKQAMSCQAGPEQHAFPGDLPSLEIDVEVFSVLQRFTIHSPSGPAVLLSRRGCCISPWCCCLNYVRVSSWVCVEFTHWPTQVRSEQFRTGLQAVNGPQFLGLISAAL